MAYASIAIARWITGRMRQLSPAQCSPGRPARFQHSEAAALPQKLHGSQRRPALAAPCARRQPTSAAPPSAALHLRPLVVAAQPIPQIELEALAGELGRALARQVGQDRLERLVLGDAGVEGLLAAEAGGDLQRFAAVVPQAR